MKRIVSIVLTISMILCTTLVTSAVSKDSVNHIYGCTNGIPYVLGDCEQPYRTIHRSIDQRICDIESNEKYSEVQKELAINKLLKKVDEQAEFSNINTRANYSYTLSVPYVDQVEDWLCSAATTEQTLMFFLGYNAPDMDDIIEALPIDEDEGLLNADDMISYINSNIPNNAPYDDENPSDIDDMILSFKVACRDYGPPILRIAANQYSNWAYTTGGHFLNVSGAYKSGDYYSFELTDPYINHATYNPSGKYLKSADTVYGVVMLHWFHGYWW